MSKPLTYLLIAISAIIIGTMSFAYYMYKRISITFADILISDGLLRVKLYVDSPIKFSLSNIGVKVFKGNVLMLDSYNANYKFNKGLNDTYVLMDTHNRANEILEIGKDYAIDQLKGYVVEVSYGFFGKKLTYKFII